MLLKIKRKDEPKRTTPLEENIPQLAPDQLGITDVAASYIEELLRNKNSPGFFLRVALRGGGCSGLSIHYEFTDNKQEKDVLFSKHSAKVIIDKKSLSILGGASLHCRDYLGSKSFILVNNPAAKQCSCGQSFSL
jgi:iron-sulfur cluster assembly protein